MSGGDPGEYGGAASIVGEYWVTLIVWLLEERPAKRSLVGSSLTSSSIEDGDFDRLDELGLLTLVFRDPSVMRQTASTCLVGSCKRVDQ